MTELCLDPPPGGPWWLRAFGWLIDGTARGLAWLIDGSAWRWLS